MITLKNVSKTIEDNKKNKKIIDNLNVDFNEHEFVTILGPNSCGKTTIIRILAEIEKYDGTIIKNKKQNFKCGVVFQNYSDSLLPWRTVFGNVLLALESSDLTKQKINNKIIKYLKEFNLKSYKDEYVYTLSGGKKQLVTICRAFAYEPDLLLLDEPFSSLDYITKMKLLKDFSQIWFTKKITTVLVTHDIDEAIYLSDRILILSDKPAKIIKDIKIKFERPRHLSFLTSSYFEKKRKKIIKIIENEKSYKNN